MFYKNTSYTTKTFYGVTFKPGETKEVPGVINNKFMVVKDAPKVTSNKVQQKPSSEKPKEEPSKSSAVAEDKESSDAKKQPEKATDDKESKVNQ